MCAGETVAKTRPFIYRTEVAGYSVDFKGSKVYSKGKESYSSFPEEVAA